MEWENSKAVLMSNKEYWNLDQSNANTRHDYAFSRYGSKRQAVYHLVN